MITLFDTALDGESDTLEALPKSAQIFETRVTS